MNPWYRFWRFWVMLYFRLYHKLECYHPERVPRKGAFILAVNHMSYLDPPLVGACCPREIYYMGRKSLFRFWWSNFVLRSVNVLPVDLEGSGAAALKTTVRLLERGQGIVMFPEGTRSPDGKLLEPQPGLGWIAVKTGAVVIPVRVWGTNLAMPKHGKRQRAYLEVKFGKMLRFKESDLSGDRKAASERIAKSIMKEIAALEPHLDREQDPEKNNPNP